MIRYFKIISQSFSAAISHPSVNFFTNWKFSQLTVQILANFQLSVKSHPDPLCTEIQALLTLVVLKCPLFRLRFVSIQCKLYILRLLKLVTSSCQVPVVTSIYMSLQLIKTWVNKSIVRYILVRKTCANVFIKQLYFFIYFVHKKRNIKKKVLVLYLWWVLSLWTVLILWRVLSLDERSKTKQTTTLFGPGSSPYAVEYSLTVTISGGPKISFVD